jgi:hypothetical protein
LGFLLYGYINMAPKYEKILTHPSRSKIVRMLNKGVGVREVARRVKELYPNDKKLHVSYRTLQDFRADNLKLDNATISVIRQEEKKKSIEREEKIIQDNLRRVPAFKEAVTKAANIHVDIRQELSELLTTVKSRVEDLFDRSAEGKLSVNEEANLHKYFASWTMVIQQWAKYIDKIADHTIETNVNITVIEDQMAVIREAIRETIEEEMNQEAAVKFMDKLTDKISALSYHRKNTESMRSIHDNTVRLSSGIRNIGGNDAD